MQKQPTPDKGVKYKKVRHQPTTRLSLRRGWMKVHVFNTTAARDIDGKPTFYVRAREMMFIEDELQDRGVIRPDQRVTLELRNIPRRPVRMEDVEPVRSR